MRKIALSILAFLVASPALADMVADWNELLASVDKAASPPEYMFNPATVQAGSKTLLAIYEAANAVDRRYASYVGLPAAARGASMDAAVATAAHDAMLSFYPGEAKTIEDAYVLALANVESSYGPIKAIRGVSLKVRRGEIVTVLGSNGAGKSTILKTISGIIDPSRGSVSFKGENITALDPSRIVRLGLSHVPEGREVFPLLSVHDNLMMGAYLRRDRDGVARDLQTVLAYFPILKERAKQDAGLLSGGQQQMLAIARALMQAPRMILLDEPSLGLSPKLTQEIFDIVLRINRERGTALMVVEQNAQIALATADIGFILEGGRIVCEGPCAELRERADIQEFYLGMGGQGARGEKRWKKKKSWQ